MAREGKGLFYHVAQLLTFTASFLVCIAPWHNSVKWWNLMGQLRGVVCTIRNQRWVSDGRDMEPCV